MDEQSIFYSSSISYIFNKNLYTFMEMNYKPIKNNIIEKIEINLLIDDIIDKIEKSIKPY